jgi:phospholipid/cholesterol/gamma-HCH transport system substrate-binding protein
MQANRERTLVGLFVLIAAGLFLGAVLAISGGIGHATVPHRFYVKFAGGVQAAAPVRYGGVNVGKVSAVRIDPGNSTRIEIEIEVDKGAPLKVDSVAKISALGPLSDNYVEISPGSRQAAAAPAGSTLPSAETFGLPQLTDAAQTLVPDLQTAVQKLNQNLDVLQVTLARANDLLNDQNRANVTNSLDGLEKTVVAVRPAVTSSLDNLDGILADARPKVSLSLDNAQVITAKLGPLLDDLKTTTARANDTLAHVDSTVTENRTDVRASIAGLRDTLVKSRLLLDHLSQTLDQNSGNIDEALDNIRMTTESLRALTDTLARSPASLIRGVKVEDRKPGEIRK